MHAAREEIARDLESSLDELRERSSDLFARSAIGPPASAPFVGCRARGSGPGIRLPFGLCD
jgi:hypothetical protein